MTTILKRLARSTSTRRPLRITFNAAKREQLGEKFWRGDVPVHYRVQTPLPAWLTDHKE
jgi:hypothetical protein